MFKCSVLHLDASHLQSCPRAECAADDNAPVGSKARWLAVYYVTVPLGYATGCVHASGGQFSFVFI